ncbi:MAG: kelch repeat-containing protein [Myxococcales bacterium]
MRATSALRHLVLALAALALVGCPNRVTPVEVKVVKDTCGKSPDPMQDVTHMRVRVVKDDGTLVSETVAERALNQGSLEALPNGESLRIQVTGFNGAPDAGGVIISHGSSVPFRIPPDIEEGNPPVKVNVFLRQVERFSPVVSVNDPANVCTELSVQRAGHTATLLDDGRVLIAGGFEAKNNNPLDWLYKETVEIYNPADGTISTDSPPMQFNGRPTSRAFHSATRLPSGQVLLAGGEISYSANGSRSMVTLAQAVLFDGSVDGGRGGWASAAMNIKRSRHTAALSVVSGKPSRALLIGGVDWSATTPNVVDGTEWFEPEVNLFKKADAKLSFKRAGHAALTTLSGQVVAVAGGHNGTKLYDSDAVRFFQADTEGFTLAAAQLELRPPRTGAAVAPLGEDRFIVLGGFESMDLSNPVKPYAGSDVIKVRGGLSRTSGPQMELPRGHVCAVGLADGRVLAIGGRGRPGANDTQEALALTNVISESNGELAMVRGDSLAEPRYFHTCTLMADGTVLVAGGVNEKGGTFQSLRSLEIYQPRPID